jgi:3-dehydroquinate dehydratase / shikimate dehydrogenase
MHSIASISPMHHHLRSRLGKVCVAIFGSSVSEMLERAKTALTDSAFLEFRLDYLAKPLAALPELKEFLSARGDVTAIATCRREENGGNFKGSLAAEFEILQKAATSGFHLIDVELESAEEAKPAELEKLRAAGAALLISYHDFTTTKDLDKVLDRMKPFAADFLKVVSTAKSLADNVTMMRFLGRTSETANVVGICMGEQGVISRILALRAGSNFTFASASPGTETAPGQIDARTLIETYRIDQLDKATRVYGVAGNPIKHSLSPIMQNTAFRRETVNAVYLALQTTTLSDLLAVVHEIPFSGLSITMPLKEEVMKCLEKTDPLSEKIGAVNTVVRSQDGKLYGFNTDVAAIVRPLEKRLPLKKAKILVLGAGGAARAAVFGLKDRGADVFILNRNAQSAQKLARESETKAIQLGRMRKEQFDVIMNATPCGMTGVQPTHILEPDELNAKLVFEMIYNPIETPLLRMARAKGLPVITGVEMFVHQGARQFEIWSGKPAPEEDMLRVVLHALRQRAESAKA